MPYVDVLPGTGSLAAAGPQGGLLFGCQWLRSPFLSGLLDDHHHDVSESESSHSSAGTAAEIASVNSFTGCVSSSIRSPTVLAGIQPSCRLPDFAVPMQPKLLKQINSFNTKEELLVFVAQSHFLLDSINLVTCVYRLAKLFCNIRAAEVKHLWRAELCHNATFQLLLRTVQSHMLHAQICILHNEDVKGLDARCVSNLIWALIKLELANDPSSLGSELVLNVSPLVIRFLPYSSSQGLANLLWAYAKMPVPPVDVMVMIMIQMSERFMRDDGTQFDAQALSNSVWSLAHIRTKLSDLDLVAGRSGCVAHFLEGIATCACLLLRSMNIRTDLSQLQAYLSEVEQRFSCQAMVNIVWSYASMLGEECGMNVHIRNMFASIRKEAISRLMATASALQQKQPWIYRAQGGFNEQALSNIVYAYEKAQLLDKELLQWVFTVATLRLDRKDAAPTFKPQELCTLLRATQLPVAQPFSFLQKLNKVVAAMPWIVSSWSATELSELNKAFGLLQSVGPSSFTTVNQGSLSGGQFLENQNPNPLRSAAFNPLLGLQMHQQPKMAYFGAA